MPHVVPDINLRLPDTTDLDTVLQSRHDAILALAPNRITLEAAKEAMRWEKDKIKHGTGVKGLTVDLLVVDLASMEPG